VASTHDAPPLLPHPAQRGLLQVKAQGGGTGANCAYAYRVRGPLEPQRLQAAYRRALALFDALRLYLIDAEAGPAWRIGKKPRIEVRLHPPAAAAGNDRPADPVRAATQIAASRFDISAGPLGAVGIIPVADGGWLVVETFDHLIADGRSLALLHEAVAGCYNDPRTAPRPCGSYAGLLEATNQPATRAHAAAFWCDQYRGFAPARLPPDSAATAGAQRELRLANARVTTIERAAARHRATLATVLFAGHAHAIARYTAHGDVAVFLAADSRSAETWDVFGQATNLVPARVTHDWQLPLGAHLSSVARNLLSLRDHLAVDVDGLDRCGAPVAVAAADATAFIFQDRPAHPPRLTRLDVEGIDLPDLHQSGGLVTVVHRESDGDLTVRVRTPPGSALHQNLAGITSSIEAFLDTLVADPASRLGGDALLPASDARLVAEVAEPTPPYPFAAVDEVILRRLNGRDTTVLVEDGRPRAAHELRAAVLRSLVALRGAGLAPRDAVLVDQSSAFERIASFLAVLRLGGMYVPVDPAAPARMRHETVARSRAVVRLTDGTVERLHPPGDRPPGSAGPLTPNDPAYVIFTSGTTGRPKGVVISRAALSNLALGEGPRFGIAADSRVLLIAPPTTDPWICHVTGALVAGATLVAARVVADAPLADVLDRERVSHAFLPASLFAQLDNRPFPHLRMIATAGDHCRPEAVARLLGRKVFNIYGPTEATVTATIAELEQASSPVPIGRPIRGLGARVMIDGAASAPPGVVGELALSGIGLAQGYLDDEAATNKRFRADPFRAGHRVYATGDRAWIADDGLIYLAGRVDRQVKIRGFRVELGHLEAVARTTGLCSDAHADTVAAPGAAGDRRLVLFVEGCPDVEDLGARLRAELPSALIPRAVVAVNLLPRHPSGKIDESRLPASRLVDEEDPVTERAVAELGPTAVLLAPLWQRLLGARPGPGDDFFALGGDSLDVLRLVREARAAGIPLAPAAVYRHTTFAGLVTHLARGPDTHAGPGGVDGAAPLGPSQQWFFRLSLPEPAWWNQQHCIPFAQMPEPATLRAALAALLAATPILSARIDTGGLVYQPTPATPPELPIVDGLVSDADVADLLERLHAGLDPTGGTLLRCAGLRLPDGSGTLVLVAHHLAVDDWSWTVIEDRLRRALAVEAAAAPAGGIDRDDGFAHFTRAISRQSDAGAFHFDAAAWTQMLHSGRTADLTQPPARTERISADLLGDPAAVAADWGVPLGAVLLGCIGHALAATEPAGATIVDLERNGRSALPGLDLSDVVGWIALHHPVRLAHTPLGRASSIHLAAGLASPPDMGLSYGALRWSHAAIPGSRVGRFAVNIADAPGRGTEHDWPAAAQLRRCAVPSAGRANHLPYEAAFVFRRADRRFRIDLTFDPRRLPAEAAVALLHEVTEALIRRSEDDAGKAPAAGPDPFHAPIPATAMQHLMLHHARRGPGIYRPRQLLAFDGLAGAHDAFLAALGRLLGQLDAFRTRFRPGPTGLEQHLAAASPVPVRRRHGNLNQALQWLDGPDTIDADVAAAGGPLVSLTAFEAPGEPLHVGMQVHHAALDGHSNRQLISVLEDLLEGHLAGTSGRGGLVPGPSHPAVRKHASIEAAIRATTDVPAVPPPAPLCRAPQIEETTLTTADVAQLATWSRAHAVDLRAAFAAAALTVSWHRRRGDTVYLVSNGRDPDVPETETAYGLFWYFQPVTPHAGDLRSLAKHVFALAGQPLRELRAAALRWPQWPPSAGLSFNYLKTAPARDGTGRVQVVAHRDLFHLPTQVEVAHRADGSARIRWTSLPAPASGGRVAVGLADYVAALRPAMIHHG